MRRAAERIVYGFLGWFESFNSVWQTTFLCIAVGVFEIGFPNLDRHLIAVLVVSLYATFTQNGLAHENKLTSDKLDLALKTIDQVVDDVFVATQAILTLARNETNTQQALISQASAIHAAISELRDHITATKEKP